VPPQGPKAAIFLGFSALGLGLSLGMNYTFFRFAAPFAATLAWSRVQAPGRAALMLAGLSLFVFSISTEVGIAFAAAAIAICVYRAWAGDGRRWLAVGLAAPAGLVALVAIFGRNVVGEMAMFSGGCLNFAVTPAPHTIILAAALVIVIPLGLAGEIQKGKRHRAMLIGLTTFSVALIPGALGRCDGGHVFWYGSALFLLSCSFASGFSAIPRRLWFGSLALVGIWAFCTGVRLSVTPLLYLTHYGLQTAAGAGSEVIERTANVIGLVSRAAADRLREDPAAQSVTADELSNVVGAGKVATPFGADRATRKMLQRTGLYSLEYFPDIDSPWNLTTEAIKKRQMDGAQWALIPRDMRPLTENIGFQQVIFQFPVSCKEIREPIWFGSMILDDLAANWTRQTALGSYWVYRHVKPAGIVR
jgi:hypothetical protein